MARKMTLKNCAELKQFACLNDYVEYCDSITKSNFPSGKRTSNSTTDQKWFGTRSYEHASKLVREGWAAGVRDVMAAMTVLAQGKDQAVMTESDFDIIGVAPVVGAYLSGDPECMYNPCHEQVAPVINVVMDISANCNVDSGHIVNRGAALLMVCSALEQNGQRVAIHTSNVSQSRDSEGWWHAQLVTVKAAELDFNIHALSYALVNASMLRRHSFRVTEGLPKQYAKMFEDGYGSSRSLKDVEGIGAAVGDIDLYIHAIDRGEGNWQTPQSAADSVMKMARDQGVIA